MKGGNDFLASLEYNNPYVINYDDKYYVIIKVDENNYKVYNRGDYYLNTNKTYEKTTVAKEILEPKKYDIINNKNGSLKNKYYLQSNYS